MFNNLSQPSMTCYVAYSWVCGFLPTAHMMVTSIAWRHWIETSLNPQKATYRKQGEVEPSTEIRSKRSSPKINVI